MTDLEVGQQLGANPLFKFFEYDRKHDHDANEWTQPAWLEARWYRQLVTPEMTWQLLANVQSNNKAAGQELIDLREPFLLPIPDWLPHVALSSAAHISEHDKNPAAGHLPGNDPRHPGQYHSLAQGHARIGHRAQRRYRITPSVWQARWGSA